MSPTFANPFLAHHDQFWLDQCHTDFKHVLYRYKDDYFVVFKERN